MNTRILNLTLLYVEDDINTRDSLAEIFKYKVEKLYVAKDGVEALELFKQHKIHFIISDFQMPRMDGNELCKAVKKIDSSIPFILLTAYNDTNLLINAIDAGIDKFLQKPVDGDKLFYLMDKIEEKILNTFQLEKSSILLREVQKVALLSYWDVNLTTGLINFSKQVKAFFHLDDKTEDEIDYKEIVPLIKDEDKTKFLEIFETRVFNEDRIDEIIAINNPDNEYSYIHIVAQRWDSSIYGSKHVVGIFQDVSHYELQKLKLLKENRSDPMLEITNKKHLIFELESLIKSSEHYEHTIGLIFFDIDNFKSINDTYGHLIADELLIELSDLIKYNIRQNDHFGRWGGDEFVLITNHISCDETISLANKILQKVKTKTWNYDINLTISIGIAFYEDGDGVDSLLHKADLKMLEAKKDGKNRFKL